MRKKNDDNKGKSESDEDNEKLYLNNVQKMRENRGEDKRRGGKGKVKGRKL